MMSNQEKVMTIRKKSVKLRFAKKNLKKLALTS